MDSGRHKIIRQGITAVIGGEDRNRPAGCHPKAVEIVAHGTGHHHAGNVVAAKHQRAFLRTGGKQRLLGNNPPKPLDGHIRQRLIDMLLNPLDGAEDIAVIPAKRRRPGQDPDVFKRLQLGNQFCREGGGGHAIDRRRLGQQ